MSPIAPIVLFLPLLAACASTAIRLPDGDGHLGREAPPPVALEPEPVAPPPLPPPLPEPPQPTYTVTVSDVPVKELLFALARDARLDLDIYGEIDGRVTLNAIDQPLPRILERISRQANLRYRLEGDTLVVSPDTAHWRTYRVPYVNLARDSRAQMDLSTQVEASEVGGGERGAGNTSRYALQNVSRNDFWRNLYNHLAALLGEPPQQSGAGNDENRPLASERLAVNRESGLVTAFATAREHETIQAFLEQLVETAQRQVLIEATVVEINLDDRHQSGVDWGRLTRELVDGLPDGVRLEQRLLGGNLASPPSAVLRYDDVGPDRLVDVSVRLLQRYGDVKVLSSPKLMTLNNQPALLKVVDNRVYFTIDVENTALSQSISNTTFETRVHTVPVGLVVTLVPYVEAGGEVILNVRPTITRILQFVNDPNPTLAEAGVVSPIPEIQVREMETVLRLNEGEIAVIGGLMQDSASGQRDGVPGLGRVPVLGRLFSYRDDRRQKTELVVFLRAQPVRRPSLDGDLRAFQPWLPEPTP